MKAAVCHSYGPPSVISIEEVEKPVPKSNEVLIKVYATAVNASDVRIRGMDAGEGVRGAVQGAVMRVIVGFHGPRNKVPGSAVSGVIEAIGGNVKEFKVGDEVMALTGLDFGGAAEYCKLSVKRAIALKPKNASFAEAVALPFGGSSALYFLRKANISTAKRVLIYGSTGSVGSAAVQAAKYYGASVDAVCSQAGMALTKQLGAETAYDYTQTKISEITGQYDVVFDAVGKIKKADAAHLLAPDGKYVTVGGLDVASELSSDLQQLAQMYEEGSYQAVIDKTFTLDDIVAAHEYVDGGHKKGNVVVTIL